MARPKEQTPPTPLERQLLAGAKQRMAAEGWSAYMLAKEAGLHQTVIREWLRGDRRLALEVAGLLAEFLGLHLADARGRTPREPKSETTDAA